MALSAWARQPLPRPWATFTGHYLDAGATRPVLAGVVQDQHERKLLADAVGAQPTVCRLQAELPINHQRLAQRHNSELEALRWHLNRSGELDRTLSRSAVDDFTVDAGTGFVTDVAVSVLRAAGWP
ncbi:MULTISPECIES: hypothetical protein [Streptomyces violaceusniger group]|uniref:hypothetical protein n=1 Tax=Streptomyces violaceusniger group TaxID=2839105 RepID=UPI00117D3B0B|nr:MULTISPECIES: hypothetical protein [Streptomyces violaceusniger group]